MDACETIFLLGMENTDCTEHVSEHVQELERAETLKRDAEFYLGSNWEQERQKPEGSIP